MFDINAIINAAIINAVNAAVEARLEAIQLVLQTHAYNINALEQQLKTITEQPKQEIGAAMDKDALRDLVTPMVASIVADKIDSVVDQAIQGHCEDYDHDNYDEIAEKVDKLADLDEFVKNDELPDFDEFITDDNLDDKVEKVIKNLNFEISIS